MSFYGVSGCHLFFFCVLFLPFHLSRTMSVNPARYRILDVAEDKTVDELADENGVTIGSAFYLLGTKQENVRFARALPVC
jgi:hypothetical protein